MFYWYRLFQKFSLWSHNIVISDFLLCEKSMPNWSSETHDIYKLQVDITNLFPLLRPFKLWFITLWGIDSFCESQSPLAFTPFKLNLCCALKYRKYKDELDFYSQFVGSINLNLCYLDLWKVERIVQRKYCS